MTLNHQHLEKNMRAPQLPLRRRFSLPEIVMRKHALLRESESRESDTCSSPIRNRMRWSIQYRWHVRNRQLENEGVFPKAIGNTKTKATQTESLQHLPECADNNGRIAGFFLSYMSSVGAGSTYTPSCPGSKLVVPRYSAFPRSVSMEVNVSSGQTTPYTDLESDSTSLVDSLDSPSPRQSYSLPTSNRHDEKPVRGELILQNINSSKSESRSTNCSAFFVPISPTDENCSSVADRLPERVRNRLSQRQRNRDQRIRNNEDMNGNIKSRLPSVNKYKSPKMCHTPKKTNPKKSSCEKLTPIYTTKKEYIYHGGPKKIYHKTKLDDSNKRIEIVDIVECITERHRTKSITSNKSVINHSKPQNEEIKDSKLDQLIANILIDTLNENHANPEPKKTISTNTQKITPYKGKAAIKDEDLSSIPKGWITFYMLHHSRDSQDSGSDNEGRVRNRKEKRMLPINGGHNEKQLLPTDIQGNETAAPVVNEGHKEENPNYHGESWSVTVAGTNEIKPEFEVRLRFVQPLHESSTPTESTKQKPGKYRSILPGIVSETSKPLKHDDKTRENQDTSAFSEYPPKLGNPRPTRTSLQRTLLRKHKKDEECYCCQDMLAVKGSAMKTRKRQDLSDIKFFFNYD